jgi:hypothetical protein
MIFKFHGPVKAEKAVAVGWSDLNPVLRERNPDKISTGIKANASAAVKPSFTQ